MKTGESISFCDTCPRKGDCIDTITDTKRHITDASTFSMSDVELGIPLELGVHFYDQAGHESDYFLPHTTVEEIGECSGQTVDYKTGFLNLKTVRDCGAFVIRAHAFRAQMDAAEARRKERRKNDPFYSS